MVVCDRRRDMMMFAWGLWIGSHIRKKKQWDNQNTMWSGGGGEKWARGEYCMDVGRGWKEEDNKKKDEEAGGGRKVGEVVIFIIKILKKQRTRIILFSKEELYFSPPNTMLQEFWSRAHHKNMVLFFLDHSFLPQHIEMDERSETTSINIQCIRAGTNTRRGENSRMNWTTSIKSLGGWGEKEQKKKQIKWSKFILLKNILSTTHTQSSNLFKPIFSRTLQGVDE